MTQPRPDRDRPRPYVLAETNWKAVRETTFDVAVLPWGATEAHNYHLPYATDVIQCDHVAAESARLAWERGTRAIVYGNRRLTPLLYARGEIGHLLGVALIGPHPRTCRAFPFRRAIEGTPRTRS